jgi:hypothetical protein
LLFDLESLLQVQRPYFDHYLALVSRTLREGDQEKGYVVVDGRSLKALRDCLEDLSIFRRAEYEKLVEDWPAVENIRCGGD